MGNSHSSDVLNGGGSHLGTTIGITGSVNVFRSAQCGGICNRLHLWPMSAIMRLSICSPVLGNQQGGIRIPHHVDDALYIGSLPSPLVLVLTCRSVYCHIPCCSYVGPHKQMSLIVIPSQAWLQTPMVGNSNRRCFMLAGGKNSFTASGQQR